MANNGNSNTYKILRKYLYKDKLIPILTIDTELDLFIKNKINKFIEKHGYHLRQYGRTNTMCSELENLVINLNQFRLKHWYFKDLKLK